MQSALAEKLTQINRAFYQDYAGAFAATRRRIQPGVRRILAGLHGRDGHCLDLGCGSGALAQAWAEAGLQGSYLGLDFSEGLLAEARRSLSGIRHPGLEIRFEQADLTRPDWVAKAAGAAPFDGILAFAVLHHIPGAANRQRLAEQIRTQLKPNGLFFLSVWQFQNSPKWQGRTLPWEMAGIDPSELEEGDTLLDWRHSLPGQEQKPGLRYVHQFSGAELQEMASVAGFRILDEFESDGQGGRLGLYQTWLAG